MVNLTEHYPRMGAPDKVPSITHRTTLASSGISGQHSVIVMDPRAHDRETLRTIIAQWNANRLKIFELSDPDENMEFYGVMRFYFQEPGDKVATKCVRVTSTQMAKEVVEILVEKFRPDMKMLTLPHFGLYETYANGEERRLKDEEKPLLVQLNWHKDDRDGRFLLKNEDEPRRSNSSEGKECKKFDRRMSKREKKELKKQKEKEDKLKSANESLGISQEQSDAEKLFKQLPETSFHRSISNPEAVMRRRRQQKLEKKLQQFKSKDGGPDTGGTLKIFGESINRDVPYKTLLLSIHDNVETVIKQTLDKYGLEREEVAKYCLMQAVLPPGTSAENVDPNLIQETALAPSDCPLQILMHFPNDRGTLIFNLKKKSDIGMQKESAANDNGISRPLLVQNPYLIESLSNGLGQAFQLFPGVTEVGNNQMRLGAANFFNVNGPDVLPSHCAFNRLEHAVTVTPFRDATGAALVLVDARKIDSTVPLNDGASVRIGQSHQFRLCIPQTFGQPLTNGHHDRTQLPQINGGTLQKRPTDFPVVNRTQYLSHQESVEDYARSETNSLIGSFRSSPNMFAASRLQILPATLEFREDRENDFLRGVIIDPNPVGVKFKLSPTYVLYMAARYRGSTNFRPEIVPLERAHLLSKFLKKVASLFLGIVQDNQENAEYLAFWLANASELLHLLKQDRHMSIYATDAHDILTQCICEAFHHLTVCQQILLERALPGLFAPAGRRDEPEGSSEDVGWGAVLGILTRTLNLVKRCRLNAALTIQLSSQLFHYISMWLLNSLVHNPERCNRHFGEWLQSGLDLLMRWADKNGLEVAADYYLAKIIQVAALLVMPKTDMNPTTYASVGHRLNSEQIRFVLDNYGADAEADPEDYPFSIELLDAVTAIAQGLADETARENGEPIQLEEPVQMNLSLTIPEEGYSVSIVKGMQSGLQEFLEPLSRAGICEMTIHPHSQGSWAVYLTQLSGERSPSTSFDGGRAMQQQVLPHPTQHSPSITQVSFPKGTSGIGLSIVATRIPAQDKLGIFVKSVVKGGAADADGRVQSGDQLLKVNGRSLVNVNQERAAELIGESGKTVHLEVLKQGAFINGLATIINDSQIPSPSPVPVRAAPNYHEQNGPRVAVPVNGHRQQMNGHPSQLPNGHHVPPPEHFHHHLQHQVPQQHHQWVPQEVKPMPPPPLPTMDIHRRRISPQTVHPGPSLQHRPPSPIRETIASQMHAQRDKIRQDAKMMEMEDEFRRRREHMQNGEHSPNMPTRGIVHARNTLNGDRRSVSQERLDTKGSRPVEKRVQWAVDNPKKSPSPTAMQQNPLPNKAVRFENSKPLTNGNGHRQEAFQPQLTNGVRDTGKAQDSQSYSRNQPAAPVSRDTSSSPSSSPWLRAEHEQIQLWRQTEARRFRDEEIENLQSRENELTAVEAERLRTLLLERDFQHRAEQRQEDGSEEEEEDDEEDEEESHEISYREEKEPARKPNLIVLPKPSPHLHHPVAASQPEVYKTQQQETFDRFVRHHEEYNAVNEAIKRSREHLDNNPDSPLTVRHSPVSPPQPNGYLSSVHEAASYGKRMTAGAEIRQEVETARMNGNMNGTASVVGNHEVYNDPRNKIMNAKVLRLPQQDNDTSPEKLSFRDKMKMFAISMGEDPKERLVTNSSRQREIDYGSS